MPSGVYKRTEKTKRKMSFAKKGNNYALGSERTDIFKNNLRKIRSGKNCNFWKGGISILSKRIRRLPEYSIWRNKVFERDNYICKRCGKNKCILHPHHKKSFSDILKNCKIKSVDEAISCKDLWDVLNGVTLCKECHKLTDNYGNKVYEQQKRN